MPVPAERPEAVRAFAPAKVNLFLHVGEKRDDGYHALESVVVFCECGDTIGAARADVSSLSASGPFASALPREEDNLALKAAQALGARAGPGHAARLTLEKNIPVASGLGGGSADAAATLRALRALWGLSRVGRDLAAVAEELGSDVPACLLSAPAWIEGRGERVMALNTFPPFALVLANPGVAVSTAEIFRRLEARTGLGAMAPPSGVASPRALAAYLGATANDLEAPARAAHPVIADVLGALAATGALIARMSGSGASCFGLYEDEGRASAAAAAIARDRPGWWVTATRIAAPDIGRAQFDQ